MALVTGSHNPPEAEMKLIRAVAVYIPCRQKLRQRWSLIVSMSIRLLIVRKRALIIVVYSIIILIVVNSCTWRTVDISTPLCDSPLCHVQIYKHNCPFSSIGLGLKVISPIA